jgi:hypothetical protein
MSKKKPKLTTMYQGKEVEYEECPPTPEAVALIMQGAAEHKNAVMEGLLFALWEQHSTTEVMDGHDGDATCTYCDIMREAAHLLKLHKPSEAQDVHVPRGPLYTEADL